VSSLGKRVSGILGGEGVTEEKEEERPSTETTPSMPKWLEEWVRYQQIAPYITSTVEETTEEVEETVRNVEDASRRAREEGFIVFKPVISNVIRMAEDVRGAMSTISRVMESVQRSYSELARTITEITRTGDQSSLAMILANYLSEMKDLNMSIQSSIDRLSSEISNLYNNLIMAMQTARRPEDYQLVIQAISRLEDVMRTLMQYRRPSTIEQMMPVIMIGMFGVMGVMMVYMGDVQVREKVVTARLNEVEYEELKKYASRWRISIAEAVREAIRMMLNFDRNRVIYTDKGIIILDERTGTWRLMKELNTHGNQK